MERQEEIQMIAYSIWQNEGCPDGRHLDHWLKAEEIWREQAGQERHVDRARSRVKRAGRKTATRSLARSTKEKDDTTMTTGD